LGPVAKEVRIKRQPWRLQMKRSVLVGFGALTILALLMAPVCALAAEWNMYGSARIELFYTSIDKESVDDYWVGKGGDGVNDDTDLQMSLQPNSRIGANVKASDAVSGRFELGTASSGVGTRLIYGDWNFGSGTLRVGQDYTPISGATSNQVVDVDDNLNSVGAVDDLRTPQIKLIMGGLQVALITNQGSASSSFSGAGYTGTDIAFPKIEVAYEFATDMMSIMPFAGYQTYDVETTGANQTSKSISSYLVGVHGRFNFGPAYVNARGHYAPNAGDFGLFERGVASTPTPPAVLYFSQSVAAASYAQLNGTSVEDATSYGAALVVGFKASDMVSLEAGVGLVKNEVKNSTGTKIKDDTICYYVNAPITLAPGVQIVPEIGVFNYGDYEVGGTKTKEGQRVYYGAKFQIDF
jgi:hypothetical protein